MNKHYKKYRKQLSICALRRQNHNVGIKTSHGYKKNVIVRFRFSSENNSKENLLSH